VIPYLARLRAGHRCRSAGRDAARATTADQGDRPTHLHACPALSVPAAKARPAVSRGLLTAVPERFADPAECFALGLAVLVGVNLKRDGQPGVTEDDLVSRAETPRFLSKVAVVCRRWWTRTMPGFTRGVRAGEAG
jgi:hypothetical protein